MTDEARIARLTPLVRKVYGPDAVLHCYCEPVVAWSVRRGEHIVFICEGERSFDALEAALLVLAEDAKVHPDGALRDAYLAGVNAGYTEQTKWVEQLAAEWEAHANATVRFTDENPPVNSAAQLIAGAVLTLGDVYRRCARELRARARGEP
jgi:hypothetical protein